MKTATRKPSKKAGSKPTKDEMKIAAKRAVAEAALIKRYPRLGIIQGSMLLVGDKGNSHKYHRVVKVKCSKGHIGETATSDCFHYVCQACKAK